MNAFDVVPTPERGDFENLVRFVLSEGGEARFVVQPADRSLTSHAHAVLASLSADLAGEELVTSSPGSHHEDHPARLHRYRASPRVAEILLANSDSFADWVNPALPQDFHVVRDDGSLLLGSIALHGTVWIDLRTDERSRLDRDHPGLAERVARKVISVGGSLRDLLLHIARGWAEFDQGSAEELRYQVDGLRMHEPTESGLIDFVVPLGTPVAENRRGILPIRIQVMDEGLVVGRVQLHEYDGRLSSILWWWDDVDRSEIPGPETFRVSVTHLQN